MELFIIFRQIGVSIYHAVRNHPSPNLLGRWKISYCPKNVDSKIDWSNEDHCGPCGEKTLESLKNSRKTKNIYKI